jgi:Protein of unknown function (DUF2971)
MVYKFIDARWGEEALRRRRLKISLVQELNDPFELRSVRFAIESQSSNWDLARNQFSLNRGFLCFSRSFHNPVLWSHYADQHKGMVIGFDIPEVSGETESVPVIYSEDLLECPDIRTITEAEKLDVMLHAFTRKFSDWKYEEEQRWVAKIDERDTVTGHYFIDFGDSMILREVIFGVNFSGDIKYIRQCLKDLNEVVFWQAHLSKRKFAIERSDITN